ncbi:class I SAM-dependent methyltransferase [Methanocaldococcus indicus]|uniref:class I SAM-dependent methyltransferase n=1 Tax=Methanocaldococcus indicus TaxID=213231 RepID=UPI003C6CF901
MKTKEIKQFYDHWDVNKLPKYMKDIIDFADTLIEEEIKDKISGFVLDAGSGFGRFYNILKDYDTIYLDISLNLLKKHKGDKKVVGNLLYLPFKDNVFDTVLCINVLEHIGIEGFKEIYRVLKRGGKAIIVFMNKDCLFKEEIFFNFDIFHKPLSIEDFKGYKIIYKKSFYFFPPIFKIFPNLKMIFKFWKRIDKLLSKFSKRGNFIILVIEKVE